eukprot:TRINITY_DN2129_c0_g1_i1.p1 TRINITY_DN2129_c0_g1~~TRINITY_DN2129_c0_g1_i1.p1  ORF type:complete len:231 (+),score=32.29 TRINITY_DN2129_c0_g1_i1:579-1271(+)
MDLRVDSIPSTSVPLDGASKILNMSAHCSMLNVIVGREDGRRELYMQDLVMAAAVSGSVAEERGACGTITLVMEGGELDAPMVICLQRLFSLVLLLSGAIVVLNTETSAVSEWSNPAILGPREKVAGLCAAKDEMRRGIVFLLGEHGTVNSFPRCESGAQVEEDGRGLFPRLLRGIGFFKSWNALFVTRTGRVFVIGVSALRESLIGVSEERARQGEIWEPFEVPLLLSS